MKRRRSAQLTHFCSTQKSRPNKITALGQRFHCPSQSGVLYDFIETRLSVTLLHQSITKCIEAHPMMSSIERGFSKLKKERRSQNIFLAQTQDGHRCGQEYILITDYISHPYRSVQYKVLPLCFCCSASCQNLL